MKHSHLVGGLNNIQAEWIEEIVITPAGCMVRLSSHTTKQEGG
jgi:hypothetical protein